MYISTPIFHIHNDIHAILSHLSLTVPTRVSPPVLTKAASSGRPALRVTWTAPSSESIITTYEVQYRRNGSSNSSTMQVTSTSTTLENLSAGTSYQVAVRAVSDIGSGPYSAFSTLSTYQGMNYCGAKTVS